MNIIYICSKQTIWWFNRLPNHIFLKTFNLEINKYVQKFVDTDKESASNALKIASKRSIQKTSEATGNLVNNFIVDKITGISKKQHVNHTQMPLAMK